MTRPSFTFEAKIEYIKNIIDYHKVLITLSSALVVLAPSLISNVFKNPQYTWLLGATIIGFIYTVLSSLVTMFILNNNMQYQDNNKYWAHNLESPYLTSFAMFSSIGVFMVTILGMASFIFINIMCPINTVT